MRTDYIEEMVDELLDEQGPIEIGNLTFNPSQVLRRMDPVAYRQTVLDVIDSRLQDLYYELDQLDPDTDADEVEEIKAQIQELEDY